MLEDSQLQLYQNGPLRSSSPLVFASSPTMPNSSEDPPSDGEDMFSPRSLNFEDPPQAQRKSSRPTMNEERIQSSKPKYPNSRHLELTADGVVAAISNAANSNAAQREARARHTLPSAYDPQKLSLVRFSTGQVLEDDFTLEWYEIKPEELFEVHRYGVITQLPRDDLKLYIQPHWEGKVKALRLIYKHPKRLDSTKAETGAPIGPAKAQSVLEWRDRWLVVREDEVLICKDAENPVASQTLPIHLLQSLRGREHLKRSTTVTLTDRQRIVCCKFGVKPKKQLRSKAHEGEYPQNNPPRDKGVLRQAYPSPSAILPAASATSSATYTMATVSTGALPSSPKPNLALKIKSSTHRTRSFARLRVSSKPQDKLRKSKSSNVLSTDDDDAASSDQHAMASAPKEDTVEPTYNPADDSDVSALSSPVFAHGNGGDVANSPYGSSDDEHQRPSYSYGYQGKRKEPSTSTDPGSSKLTDAHADAVSTRSHRSRKKGKDAGEWVVLDLKDDNGYTSLLRVLHRMAPAAMNSSFTLSSPYNTPNRTVPSSPVVSTYKHGDGLSHKYSKSTLASSTVVADSDTSSPSHASYAPTEKSPPLSRRASSHPRTSSKPHPTTYSSFPSDPTTFGAIPYPEWRMSASVRARKAGIGEVGAPMEAWLFGNSVDILIRSESPRGRSARRNPDDNYVEDDGASGRYTARQSMQSSDTQSTIHHFPIRDFQDTDFDEELSEREWLGWIGDLHRQAHVRDVAARAQLEEEAMFDNMDSDDPDPLPKTSAEDQQQLQDARRALEPCGIVVSMAVSVSPEGSTAPSSPKQSAVRRLASPSSNESLGGSSRSTHNTLSERSTVNYGGLEEAQGERNTFPRRASIASGVGRSPSVLSRSNIFKSKKEPTPTSDEAGSGTASPAEAASSGRASVRRVKSSSSLLESAGMSKTKELIKGFAKGAVEFVDGK